MVPGATSDTAIKAAIGRGKRLFLARPSSLSIGTLPAHHVLAATHAESAVPTITSTIMGRAARKEKIQEACPARSATPWTVGMQNAGPAADTNRRSSFGPHGCLCGTSR